MGNKTRTLIGKSSARARLQPADDSPAAAPDGDLLWCGPVEKSQLCVLVVDDDADAAERLSTMVKTWGHQVWVAGDGAEALDMALAYQPGVLLLDIVMPNMDGCQVARRLRRQARFESTLLLAMLDGADREQRARAEAAGVDLCLVKPIEPSTLQVLLLLEQEWLPQTLAAVSAIPTKDTTRKSARTGIQRRLPAAEQEQGCLSYAAHKAKAPTDERRDQAAPVRATSRKQH
jgi:CheY-like chemotaxis protein